MINLEKLWKKNLRDIEPYVPGEQSENPDIIKLNANENPYPPSPKVVETLKHFDSNMLRRYPSSSASELKKVLAEFHGIDKNCVFVGNGSDEVIALSFMAFFNSKKPILFPDITYSFYPVWCSLYKIPYITKKVTEDFTINPSDYYEENGGVIIPNPNAPTGKGEKREFIEDILEHNKDCIVIIDEAYVDFSEYSCVELIKKYDNLVVVQTFSKSRSLAGIRVGAAFGNPELISVLEAVKNSYNSYTIDSIALELAIASIKDKDYFELTNQKIKLTRERTTNALRDLGFKVYDSDTNFIFVDCGKYNAKEIMEYLKTKNIYIRYFNIPRINNHLRITIGTDFEMAKTVEEIENFIK